MKDLKSLFSKVEALCDKASEFIDSQPSPPNMYDPEFLAKLDSFNNRLNEPPKKEVILERDDINVKRPDGTYGKFRYLPIDYLQNTAQSLLGGLKETSFREKVVVNEVIGVLTVEYFHPVFMEWFQLQGMASVIIQQNSGSKPDDVNAKKKNAMVMGYPHLKSDCLRNALSGLGKAFGRGLNREHTHSFEDYSLSSAEHIVDLNTQIDVMKKSSRLLEGFKEKVRLLKTPTEIYKGVKDIYDQAVKTGEMIPGDLQELQRYAKSRYAYLKQMVKSIEQNKTDK